MKPHKSYRSSSQRYSPWRKPNYNDPRPYSTPSYTDSGDLIKAGLNVLRPLLIAGIAIAGIAHGCQADTEGTGNEFDIKGRVVFTHGSLTRLKVVEVVTAEGTAARIDVGDIVPFYDQYKDDDCDLQQVGAIDTVATRPNEKHDQLREGDYVEFTGTRRDSFQDCGKYPDYGERNVFESGATFPA